MQNVHVRAQLESIGLTVGSAHRNLPAAELTARSLARQEGILAANGALVVHTGARTGRSPADRFIVDEAAADGVAWSQVNQKCTPELFDRMLRKASTYLHSREVFVFDGYAGADKAYRLPIRVVADTAWHALFAQTLFLQPIPIEQEGFVPGFTIIDCGALHADPDVDGTRSAVFIGISFSRRLVLIFGTMYAGEMKKAVFAIMNYLLPPRGVLPLHCSANVGRKGDVALYFGLSGTGKTTLQPIWVGDVVSCLLRALTDEEVLDRTIPIGGPQHLTYEEIADQVAKMLNLPRMKIHLSRRMVSWMARLLSGVGQNPFLGYRHLELLEVGTITALDAVRRNFGFQPMPLIEGVAYHLMSTTERGRLRPPSGVERGSQTRGRH